MVRVLPFLNEKPYRGKVYTGHQGEGRVGISLTRTDLAWFLLEHVASDQFVRKAQVISE